MIWTKKKKEKGTKGQCTRAHFLKIVNIRVEFIIVCKKKKKKKEVHHLAGASLSFKVYAR